MVFAQTEARSQESSSNTKQAKQFQQLAKQLAIYQSHVGKERGSHGPRHAYVQQVLSIAADLLW